MSPHGFATSFIRSAGGIYTVRCLCAEEFSGHLAFAKEQMAAHLSYFEERAGIDLLGMSEPDVRRLRDVLAEVAVGDADRLLVAWLSLQLGRHQRRTAA